MEPARRTRTAGLLLLVVLAWSPGVLFAGCAAACPFGAKAAAGHRCCRPQGSAPAFRTRSCCQTLRTAAPVETSRAVQPSAAALFVLAAPLALLSQQVSVPTPELPPPSPPPLHEGLGLYTLHSVFLI